MIGLIEDSIRRCELILLKILIYEVRRKKDEKYINFLKIFKNIWFELCYKRSKVNIER